jgi:OmpA-OmpF porin, OOP family
MRFKFALVAALALLASPAWSATDGTGFFVGAGIGASDLASGPFSGSDFAYKLFGGYDLKYIGIEGAYMDGGSPSDHDLKIDVTGWDLALRGILPISDQFNLFAKVGVVWWDVSAHGYDLYGKDSGNDLLYGVGAGFGFTPNFGMRGEWERMDIQDTDRADLWTVSAYWKF